MRVACFYHLYAAGAWREPVTEWLSALTRIGFDGLLRVGIVGRREQRADAWRLLSERWPSWLCAAAAETGFEQVTLDPLRDYALANPGDAILYAHTKGAGFPSSWEDRWRRSMTCALLADLDSNVAALAEHDAVGCHWLTAADFPGAITVPMFGGNFWLARGDYLARLPACSRQSRHEAEAWIGRGDPPAHARDLQPGWPGVTNCVTRIGWPH